MDRYAHLSNFVVLRAGATAAAAAAAAVHETSQVGGQVGTVVDSHRVEPDGLVLGSGLGSRFRLGLGLGLG